ncbi:DUF3199 family protein [Bacillus sp. FSL K6-0047]
MFITPDDLKEYSSFSVIQKRSDVHLRNDIVEAEVEIKRLAGQDFSDYEELPEAVKIATLKMAQYFALTNADQAMAKGIKQERFENYSYTLEGREKPDVSGLLSAYVKKPIKDDTARVRLRVL